LPVLGSKNDFMALRASEMDFDFREGAQDAVALPGYLNGAECQRLREEETWRNNVALHREAITGQRQLREKQLARQEVEAHRLGLYSRAARAKKQAEDARMDLEALRRGAGTRSPMAQQARQAEEVRQQADAYRASATLPRPTREALREDAFRERVEDYRSRLFAWSSFG